MRARWMFFPLVVCQAEIVAGPSPRVALLLV